MNSKRITINSHRHFVSFNHIWWLIAASLLGIFVYLRYDNQVFPTASINLEVPKSAIVQTSRSFVHSLGYDEAKAIESTQFTLDQSAKTFLEYELGIDQANQLMKNTLPIWSWRTRFCRQYEQEEFRIWLSPAGQLQGFFHELENDRALPSLSRADALNLAKQFIEQNTNLSLGSYNLIKSASFSQAHRTDHSFTWQDTSQDFHGARLRIQVGIAGNLVDQFNYSLYVPESFERKFSTLRSDNELLESVASVFYSLLQLTSVFIFFWAVSTKRIRWRFSIILAAFLTSIDFIEHFNNIASVIDTYNTQKLFGGYLAEFVVQCIVGCITKFITYLMLVGSAELIYRLSYPKKIALENLASPTGYRSKPVLWGNLIGHILIGIDLGWIVIYYLSGKWWHVWCPSGVDNYQVLSTIIPFFSAIATGVSAAIGEELLFRVIALSLFQRLVRFFWLANILQAAAWGFMHSTYPQEPAYARGLELTFVGVFHGWILRRYGVLPCLIGHYLFDALISCKPLFSAQDLWLKLSAFIPVLPFLLLLIFAYWRNKKLGDVNEKPLQNRALLRPPTSTQDNTLDLLKNEEMRKAILASDKPASFIRNLTKPTAVKLFLLIFGSLFLILPLSNYQAINKDAALSINRKQAIALATQELSRRHINTESFKSVGSLVDESNSLEMQYVFEQIKLPKTLEIARTTEQGLFWRIRFLKPLEPIEYEVWVDQTGAIADFAMTEPEDTPEATLSPEIAKSKVEQFLQTQHPEWQPYKFESSFENKRKARTDFTFTFTVPHLKVKDADFKVSASVLGDVISNVNTGYDIPDQWLNERNKKTIKDEVLLHLRTAFNVFLFIAVLIWAFGLLRSGQIKWRSAYLFALPPIALSLIQRLNDYPQFYRVYVTTLPLYSFVLRQVTNYLQSVQSNFLYYFCGFALALAALSTIGQYHHLRSFISYLMSRSGAQKDRATFWFNSWLIAFSVASFHSLINAVADFFHVHYSPACPQESLSIICNLANVAYPWLAILIDAFSSMLSKLMLVGLFVGLYKRFCPGFSMYALFILLLNLVTHSSERYWQDYIVDVISASFWDITIWYFIVKIIGFNPLAYCLIGAMESLFSYLIDLVPHAWPKYANVVDMALLLLFAPLLYSVYLFYSANRKTYKNN